MNIIELKSGKKQKIYKDIKQSIFYDKKTRFCSIRPRTL